MILTGHQPNYLPNLAFFAKMVRADVFVVTTNLQIQMSKGWVRRNKIPGQHGDLWLTVPVHGTIHDPIRVIMINNSLEWSYKHQKTLQSVYGHSPGKEMIPLFCEILDRRWNRIAELNWELIRLMASLLDIQTALVLDEEIRGRRQEIVINACNKYGASRYLAGTGGTYYMDDEYIKSLRQHRIDCVFMEDIVPSAQYPYSTIHYLLAHGKEWVQEKIKEQSMVPMLAKVQSNA